MLQQAIISLGYYLLHTHFYGPNVLDEDKKRNLSLWYVRETSQGRLH